MKVKDLIAAVESKCTSLNYHCVYLGSLRNHWNKFALWLPAGGDTEFSRECAEEYMLSEIRKDKAYRDLAEQDKTGINAIYKLIDFNETGQFRYRVPFTDDRILNGDSAVAINAFLEKVRKERSARTAYHYEIDMFRFNQFLEKSGYSIDDLSVARIDEFYTSWSSTPSTIYVASGHVRRFLQFAYDSGFSSTDCSVYVLPVCKPKKKALPTTYSIEEIKAMCEAVDRSSAIGKRNYVILLLATVYGIRSSDITSLKLDDIDWDNSRIHIVQQKTEFPAGAPLLDIVGDAIIDYLLHGRPETEARELIVSSESSKRGRPLSPPTIHSIVSKYLVLGGVNIEGKKHGPHSLRHSLATNMLSKNVSLPVVKTVLAHQSTETTMIYISLDEQKLKLCALPVPPIGMAKGGGR